MSTEVPPTGPNFQQENQQVQGPISKKTRFDPIETVINTLKDGGTTSHRVKRNEIASTEPKNNPEFTDSALNDVIQHLGDKHDMHANESHTGPVRIHHYSTRAEQPERNKIESAPLKGRDIIQEPGSETDAICQRVLAQKQSIPESGRLGRVSEQPEGEDVSKFVTRFLKNHGPIEKAKPAKAKSPSIEVETVAVAKSQEKPPISKLTQTLQKMFEGSGLTIEERVYGSQASLDNQVTHEYQVSDHIGYYDFQTKYNGLTDQIELRSMDEELLGTIDYHAGTDRVQLYGDTKEQIVSKFQEIFKAGHEYAAETAYYRKQPVSQEPQVNEAANKEAVDKFYKDAVAFRNSLLDKDLRPSLNPESTDLQYKLPPRGLLRRRRIIPITVSADHETGKITFKSHDKHSFVEVDIRAKDAKAQVQKWLKGLK